jgi:hypothetical protein
LTVKVRCFSSILICNSAVFALACCVDLTARRLLPLAPQVSQVGNTALVIDGGVIVDHRD